MLREDADVSALEPILTVRSRPLTRLAVSDPRGNLRSTSAQVMRYYKV